MQFFDQIFLLYWLMNVETANFHWQKKIRKVNIKWRHNAHSNQISQKPKFPSGRKWFIL